MQAFLRSVSPVVVFAVATTSLGFVVATPAHPVGMRPAQEETPEAQAKRLAETTHWAIERARSGEFPTNAAELKNELALTREGLLALAGAVDFAVKRAEAAELRAASPLDRTAAAFVRRKGWTRGSVKGSISVEERFGSTTYWVIDIDGDFKPYIVKDGGLMGWSRFNPNEFWARSDGFGFSFIEASGSESSVSKARLDYELEQKIRDKF